MFRKLLWDWAYQCGIGIGCSLIAAAALGVITGGTPAYISFAAVVGVLLPIFALVLKLSQALPSSK